MVIRFDVIVEGSSDVSTDGHQMAVETIKWCSVDETIDGWMVLDRDKLKMVTGDGDPMW